jgi:hypothetical protein
MEFGRLVTQRHEWGCGAACVASLLAISYSDALARLEQRKGAGINEQPKGLEPSPIVHVLRTAGYEVAKQYKTSSWPLGTIVLLTWEFGRYKGCGHYMLLTARGWMDPWYNLNKRPRKAQYRSVLPKNTAVKTALVAKRS